jgi:hypothetical protein
VLAVVAEYILWGDQNEPRIFDFFLENNILTYLHKVLLQSSNRSGEVAKQVRAWEGVPGCRVPHSACTWYITYAAQSAVVGGYRPALVPAWHFNQLLLLLPSADPAAPTLS